LPSEEDETDLEEYEDASEGVETERSSDGQAPSATDGVTEGAGE